MRIRLGARASELAIRQSNLVLAGLSRLRSDVKVEICHIQTSGDKKQGTPAASKGDKKDWIYELELALLAKEIDLAVHSGKDVPADIENGTVLYPVLQRANPKDVFIGKMQGDTGRRLSWHDLPVGASVGTASLRRRAQLLKLRPDLNIVELRGNVPTRLRKLDEKTGPQGLVLARAGLERLNLLPSEFYEFSISELMPAVNQGILVAQCRSEDATIEKLLRQLADAELVGLWQTERACVEVLGADCNSALSVYAESLGQEITLSARVFMPDGSQCLEFVHSGPAQQAQHLGVRVAKRLLELGAATLLEQSRSFPAFT